MESSDKDQHHRQDDLLRRKILAAQENQYDTQKGWHQLESKLAAAPQKTSGKRASGKKLFAWRMVAAAMILLAIGFFTGRWTTKQNGSSRQNIERTAGLTGLPNNKPSHHANRDVARQALQGLASGHTAAATSGKTDKTDPAAAQQKKVALTKARPNHSTHTYTATPGENLHELAGIDQLPQSAKAPKAGGSSDRADKPIRNIAVIQPEPATSTMTMRPAVVKGLPGKAANALPVVSLSETKILSVATLVSDQVNRSGASPKSIYRRISSGSGSSSDNNNPFKIRF